MKSSTAALLLCAGNALGQVWGQPTITNKQVGVLSITNVTSQGVGTVWTNIIWIEPPREKRVITVDDDYMLRFELSTQWLKWSDRDGTNCMYPRVVSNAVLYVVYEGVTNACVLKRTTNEFKDYDHAKFFVGTNEVPKNTNAPVPVKQPKKERQDNHWYYYSDETSQLGKL